MTTLNSVIRTAYDALLAKQSALNVGYQPVKKNQKEYADLLQIMSSRIPNQKRQAPLVNAGYAARISVVTSTINSFIDFHKSGPGNIQLVILGSGLDVLGLWAQTIYPKRVKVFEIDTEEICMEKRRTLASAGLLNDVHTDEHLTLTNSGQLCASTSLTETVKLMNYSLLSCDLRNTTALKGVCSQIDCSLPTLVLSELVLAYLGRAGVDNISRFVAEHLCTGSTSAFVVYEVLGASLQNYRSSAVDAYKARYNQQFVKKLERGFANANSDDIFHCLGNNKLAVETRLERAGFGFAKACIAGHAAACLTTLTPPEPFDEHAALALHLSSYVLAISFASTVSLNLVRTMCPWSEVTKQNLVPRKIKDADGSNVVIVSVEVSDQQAVQDLFVCTYEELCKDHKAVRKMVKCALRTDLLVSNVEPLIARKYAMWGGAFLVARRETDQIVIGCIGVRLCPAPNPLAPLGLLCFEVNRLLVKKTNQGKGIGKALLQSCHDFLVSEIGLGTPYAAIATTPQLLASANRLYHSFGYRLRKVEHQGGITLNTYIYCNDMDDFEQPMERYY